VHQHLLLEAVDTLVEIQRGSQPDVLPEYDEALLLRELSLFPDWYCAKELQKPLDFAQKQLWDAGVKALLPALLAQPKVFVHRDFIVRNLMLGAGAPGVLDFQDAVYGPVSYDLVSLLRDAFIEWEEPFVLDIAIRYSPPAVITSWRRSTSCWCCWWARMKPTPSCSPATRCWA
jgi:aminoglycoside/choline kinase family phosphotransferase